MEIEEFVLTFCSRLTDVLRSQNISGLSETDYELCKFIRNHQDIDRYTPTEKNRTDMEVWLYSECNKHADNKFRERKAFDFGSEIERIDKYFELLNIHLTNDLHSNIPNTLVNIKDLVIGRLKMIELSTSVDREVLIYKDRLEKIFNGKKKDIDDEIEESKKKWLF